MRRATQLCCRFVTLNLTFGCWLAHVCNVHRFAGQTLPRWALHYVSKFLSPCSGVIFGANKLTYLLNKVLYYMMVSPVEFLVFSLSLCFPLVSLCPLANLLKFFLQGRMTLAKQGSTQDFQVIPLPFNIHITRQVRNLCSSAHQQ